MAGHVDICKYIMDNIEDKNPETVSLNGLNDGITPLEDAVFHGKYEVCKSILDNIEDKNPYNSSHREFNFGNTLFHDAANLGHFEICRLFFGQYCGHKSFKFCGVNSTTYICR